MSLLFLFLNFLMICLYNSSAKSLFPFLAVPSEFFFLKNFQTIEAVPLWYPSYFEFLVILNALSHNISLESVLLVKYLKAIVFVLINISRISCFFNTAQKRSFPLRISSVNLTKSAIDLVTFSEETLKGKLHFLCSVSFVFFLCLL